MIKVGNTSFQEETIKKMAFKEFKETYKVILKGRDFKEVYQKITGIKGVDSKESEKDDIVG